MINFKDKDLGEFLKHSKNYISASFFLKGLALISIPIITYLLSPEEYGKVGIFTSLVNFLVILLSLNTFTSIVRYYHENEKRIFEFIWTLIIFLIPFLIVINIVFYNSIKLLLLETFNIENNIFLGALISASLFILVRYYLSFLQTSQQSYRYNKISTLRGFALLLLTITLYYFLTTDKYLGRIYAEIVVNIVFVIYVIVAFYTISSRRKFNASLLKYSLSYSIPLIPHALSVVLLNSSDRIILNQLRGPVETGYYTFAYQVGLALEIVIIGTNKSWVPMFFKRIKENKYDDIEKLAVKYKKLIFLLAVILILYVGDVVKLLANKSYHNSLDIIPIILISYCFMFIYTIYGNYALYSKKTLMIAINTLIAGTVNIILNYIFIPEYGYFAASLSTLVSFFLLMIMHYLSAKFILSIKPVSILKLISGIFWVFGAYGIMLIGKFININPVFFQIVKFLYGIFVFGLMYPMIIRMLIRR